MVILTAGVYWRIMPKRLKVEGHVQTGELERRYRESRDPVERSQYQIVWLLSQGRLTREVMAATGYSRGWIQELARRYNAGGPDALGDRRRHNPGGADRALLDGAGRARLREALGGEAPGGGLWNGRKVAEWMAGKLGRTVGERRGWEYLHALGYTPKVPRPSNEQADPEGRAAFPKG